MRSSQARSNKISAGSDRNLFHSPSLSVVATMMKLSASFGSCRIIFGSRCELDWCKADSDPTRMAESSQSSLAVLQQFSFVFASVPALYSSKLLVSSGPV